MERNLSNIKTLLSLVRKILTQPSSRLNLEFLSRQGMWFNYHQILEVRVTMTYLNNTFQKVKYTYSGSQFQIKVTFYSLLGNCLGNTFRVTSFKLTGQEVTQPSFQQWSYTSHEEQPHPPSWAPETTPWSLANCSLWLNIHYLWEFIKY